MGRVSGVFPESRALGLNFMRTSRLIGSIAELKFAVEINLREETNHRLSQYLSYVQGSKLKVQIKGIVSAAVT